MQQKAVVKDISFTTAFLTNFSSYNNPSVVKYTPAKEFTSERITLIVKATIFSHLLRSAVSQKKQFHRHLVIHFSRFDRFFI